jgi:acetyltransferase-like isoleucine patch superfamily enzyme
MMAEYFSHPTAIVEEGALVGRGTKIWHFAQIRKGAVIGEDCNIGKDVYIDIMAVLGNRVKVQNFVSIYRGVEIGDDVFVGPSVTFTNDLYPRAEVWDENRIVKTSVGKGASIGANATIICGVRLGDYCMVGAGSVVTKDVSSHELVYGNPARHMGWICFCGRKAEGGGPEFACPCGRRFRGVR